MYKPSYILGYKFGTGMKQQQKYPNKLLIRNKEIFLFVCLFLVEYIHQKAFAQIFEGPSLATTS